MAEKKPMVFRRAQACRSRDGGGLISIEFARRGSRKPVATVGIIEKEANPKQTAKALRELADMIENGIPRIEEYQ